MSPDRWQQIEVVFQSALDLSPDQRELYLAEHCRNDQDLRAEVEKLLADYESADSFIESPVWTDSRFLNSSAKKVLSDSFVQESKESQSDFFVGKRIGVYRLTKEIGRGGMGAVYLAERADGEFSQKVAIKLIKRGMDSDFIVRRFRHERQILASFEHPFIARLLDGGTTAENLPYFVMEFIEGDTLYNFCDKKRLDVKERLKIFQKICSALTYAHEKQIIHRDIKPSNILVTRHDVPKLLDFGIAKVLNPDLIHESVNPTASVMRLMTPDYASPEQVCGQEVTASSDIYSLGILLYELLTGHRPYNFAGRALHEISRVICEMAPDLPSEILEKDENLLPQNTEYTDKYAHTRSTTPAALKRELKGNLDNIILKALAKDTSERYASVREFSEDISRHLSGEPVLAKAFAPKPQKTLKPLPENAGKSLAVLPFKFINLIPSENTGDSFLGLGLADALIARLSQVRRFVVRPTSSVLPFQNSLNDPIKAGMDLGVDFILDGNIKKANERLRVTVQLLNVAENATIWATSIDETLADVFTLEDTLSTKVIEVLLPQLTGSEREEFSKRGTNNAEAFEKYLRGRYYFNSFTEDGFARAFVSFHEAIAADPNYAHAYAGIADYYNWLGIFGVLPPQDCFQSAISAATKAIEIDEGLSEGHASLGFSLHAGNYDWAKAEQHLSRALELNPNNATAYVWYSIVLYTEARFAEALEFARRGLELDPLTPFNMHNLGWGFYYARRYDDGINQYKRLIADFPTYGLGYYGLSKIYRIIGKTAESVDEIQKAKELFNDSVFSLLSEAESYAADGQRAEAEDKLNKLIELSKTRYVSPYQLSLVYCYLNEKEKALELLEKAFEIKEAWLNWMGIEPVFDILRPDERFQKILENIGYHYFFNNFSVSHRNIIKPDAAEKSDENDKHLTPSTQIYNFHNETTLQFRQYENAADDSPARAVSSKPEKSARSVWMYSIGAIAILIFGAIVLQFAVRYGYYYGSVSTVNSGYKAFQNPSIVVFPFKNDNISEDNLGVGFADALSRKLGNIKRLTVISPSSGRAVANESLQTITNEMGVVFVVRGNLNKNGNNLSVSAEMVNSSNGEVLWSETLSDSSGDLFSLQTKLAEKIWTSLSIEPLPMEKEQIYRGYTKNQLAYQLFLVGRYQMANRSPENLRKAITSFNQALDEDENFALAYVGLADAYLLLNLYDVEPPANAYKIAEEAALKAISNDDNLASAHTSLGYIKFFNYRDRAGSELEFRRAIQINPSYAQAHHWFSLTLSAMKRPIEAISEAQTAEHLDPRSSAVKTALCMAHYYGRQYDQALTICEKSLALNEDFVPAHKTKRWIYLAMGKYQEALDSFRKEYSYSGGNNEPGWTIIKSQVEALGSNRDKALSELKQAIETPTVKNNPYGYAEEVALAFNAFGDKENALLWLERAEAANNHGFNFIAAHPRFENLQNEPRFQALLKKLQTPKN
ncbi:MAG TPA: protein kinase [Pyrinomonadaceae bacterium]|jgi:serine/threonine protein kinase/Tfp pilus assembly protein PilF